jgi:hypothetical protein
MTNLAEQSLGHPVALDNPLTLQEKRQAYNDWLKTGREANRTSLVQHIRTDEHPTDPILAVRRATAHTDSAAKLLHSMEPGYICRTDEGEGTSADVSEEVRLKLAGALAEKMAGADNDTATRMASAANALLASGRRRT